MAEYSIRDLIHRVLQGLIRIPNFQRGFVWDSDAVAFLFDTIYKGYPFGTIQLWRTREQLKTEKSIGPFRLFERDPDYPIDYVLDGQQRITSIFSVFQSELLVSENKDNVFSIYFDYTANTDSQESQFYALSPDEVDTTRHFPLNSLFNTIKYREATNGLPMEVISKIDELQAIFKEVKIPYQMLETEDRTKVAIAFERINRKAVPLDTFQLLSAWTWSDEFVLQRKFEELAEELEPYGFEEVGGNINLLLRISSAVITHNASSGALMAINGTTIRKRFDEIFNGVRGAIDFLKNNFKIESLRNLPYENILVPLSVFFAAAGNECVKYNDKQRKILEKWFWRTCFSKRYSAGLLKTLNRDIEEILKMKKEFPNNLSSISCNISKAHFQETQFLMSNVNTKTFILMLAQFNPKSLLSGSPVSLAAVLKDYNRNEFHHIYPRSYLRSQSGSSPFRENCLANFSFISKADNKIIGGEAPSKYRRLMGDSIEERLLSAAIPETEFLSDNYGLFIEERAKKLIEKAHSLIN